MKEITVYKSGNEPRRRLVGLFLCLVVYAGLTAGLYRAFGSGSDRSEVQITAGNSPPRRNVTVQDGFFHVDGEPFLVKAVGWDPVRPGELPWQREFHREEVEEDLRRIREAGFNTIRSWAPLREEELALAAKYDLRVLQGIWVPQDGDFADPEFRRKTLAEVARAVESSRWSPAILGYLVWNEPRAAAVARAGLEPTLSFLREVAATVRGLDPSAPIGFANWPGLEAVDDELLDFVGFNIYPHRPRVVMKELGLGAYVNLVREEIAGERPLVITEFGISVSPEPGEIAGRGGASEEEQAEGLCGLLSTYVGSGATGASVFQWSDGWWKNNEQPGDERTHDPKDPEEWFGLIEYEDVDDRTGKPRPALGAYRECQSAVVVKPENGFADASKVPLWIHAGEPVSARLRVNGGEPRTVELSRSGRSWFTGDFSLPAGSWRHEIELEVLGADGELLRREKRLLKTGPEREVEVSISPEQLTVAPGESFAVEVELEEPSASGEGEGEEGAESRGVTVATYTEDRFNEDTVRLQAAPNQPNEVSFEAPEEETVLTLLAFEDDPELPPWERAATLAVVVVREAP